MTLQEFQRATEKLSDAEFWQHLEVRRVYWAVVEPGKKFRHVGMYPGVCPAGGNPILCRNKCGAYRYSARDPWRIDMNDPRGEEWKSCVDMPDCIPPLPGSPADAVEQMREKVKWPFVNVDYVMARVLDLPEHDKRHPLLTTLGGWYRVACEESLRVRFMFFAAAAGGLEIQ